MTLVVSAVGLAGVMWFARFVAQYVLRIPFSQKETVFLGSAVMSFLLLTNAVRDPLMAIAYGGVLVAGYLASKFATGLMK